jgi:hypothetical protein
MKNIKLTKTSAIAIIGFLAAILSANSAWINPYFAETIISILMLAAYNLFPSDSTGGKPAINWISILSLIAAISGYLLDHPHEVIVNGVATMVYLIPVTILACIKNTIVALVRFWETTNK